MKDDRRLMSQAEFVHKLQFSNVLALRKFWMKVKAAGLKEASASKKDLGSCLLEAGDGILAGFELAYNAQYSEKAEENS